MTYALCLSSFFTSLNFPTGYRCNLICHEQLVPRSCRSYSTKSSWHKSWVDKHHHVLPCVTLKGRLFAIWSHYHQLILPCLCGGCGKSCSKKEKRTQEVFFKNCYFNTTNSPCGCSCVVDYVAVGNWICQHSVLFSCHTPTLVQDIFNLFFDCGDTALENNVPTYPYFHFSTYSNQRDEMVMRNNALNWFLWLLHFYTFPV